MFPPRILLDLLLPPTCAGCGREGQVLCAQCLPALARRLREPPGLPIGLALPLPPGLVQLEWCTTFTGPARRTLHALKYGGERRLADPLGKLLAARLRHAGLVADVLVPVPIHVSRLRDRGFNQAELLARSAGAALRLPVVDAVARGQQTQAQHGLGRAARSANVGGAFRRGPHAEDVRDRWVVIVDDVVTTGATLASCAGVLLDSGAAAVSALTVARER